MCEISTSEIQMMYLTNSGPFISFKAAADKNGKKSPQFILTWISTRLKCELLGAIFWKILLIWGGSQAAFASHISWFNQIGLKCTPRAFNTLQARLVRDEPDPRSHWSNQSANGSLTVRLCVSTFNCSILQKPSRSSYTWYGTVHWHIHGPSLIIHATNKQLRVPTIDRVEQVPSRVILFRDTIVIQEQYISSKISSQGFRFSANRIYSSNVWVLITNLHS